MGYAQIAGLPPAYGLYGSILLYYYSQFFFYIKTIYFFGVESLLQRSCRQCTLSLGIVPGSEGVELYTDFGTFYWSVASFLLHYKSRSDCKTLYQPPVMGGFISGISLTIIFMQIPKLMGSSAGSGEIIELAEHIYLAGQDFHGLSLGLGLGTLLIIRICKNGFQNFNCNSYNGRRRSIYGVFPC